MALWQTEVMDRINWFTQGLSPHTFVQYLERNTLILASNQYKESPELKQQNILS